MQDRLLKSGARGCFVGLRKRYLPQKTKKCCPKGIAVNVVCVIESLKAPQTTHSGLVEMQRHLKKFRIK